ncbi:hypothetical protein QWY93_19325 [Echinicola jeungdonensis]|uniref:hypothetical protein n=1 Tax=Echinicola jeungdonensis TaxID=709343 RepID=UPI0025B39B50|nr:hypothetical protein [Echinicola jeungdonensis]MDN3671408.1 hypothetical protein [Echinicola jeungdonensis]
MNTRNILIIISLIILVACSSSNEDQFEYQEEKVLDKESGMNIPWKNLTPLPWFILMGHRRKSWWKMRLFYGSEKGTKFIKSGESRLEKREEALMAEKKQKIKRKESKGMNLLVMKNSLKNLTGFERRMPPFPSKWT